jgi:hypothetical protein
MVLSADNMFSANNITLISADNMVLSVHNMMLSADKKMLPADNISSADNMLAFFPFLENFTKDLNILYFTIGVVMSIQ